MELEKKCGFCGKYFIARRIDTICCSNTCSASYVYQRKKQEREKQRLQKFAMQIKEKDFLSVSEACKLYQVSKHTIYRQIKLGRVTTVNFGTRMLRISKTDLEKRFIPVDSIINNVTHIAEDAPKAYYFDERDCYTMKEVCDKYKLDFKVVKSAVDSHSIPICHRGFHVFVPRVEIDALLNPTNKKIK